MKTVNMGDNPDYAKKFEKALNLAGQLAAAAAMTEDNICGGLCMAMAVSAGALGAVATIIQHENDKNPPNGDHLLFAALLVTTATSPLSKSNDTIFAFDPSIILDTLNLFEKMTGRKADPLLMSGMVGAAREMAKSGAAPLDAFMAARPTTSH